MNKISVAKIAQNTRRALSRHSPEILMGIGIAGMFTTTILAVRATPKALRLIEEKKAELEVDELTAVETIKAAWKPYIPAAITCVSSTACLIGSNTVHARRGAALATAYKISETALAEYRDKVIETVGEKKEKAIRDSVNEEHIKKDPVSQKSVIVTGKGTTLCYDYHSGRYFDSDIELIRKAVNVLNRNMTCDIFGYVSLNDFYDELGLEHTRIGDELGWKLEDGLIDIDFSAKISDDGRPCIVLDYNIAPKHGYSKYL